MDTPWGQGVWLGRSVMTNEHIVGLPTGVLYTRAIKTVPEEKRWNPLLYQAMVWTPWHCKESADSAPALAAWTPTEGCVACEEEAMAVRRRGRPRNHTAACLQRRAEMRMRTASTIAAPTALQPPHVEKVEVKLESTRAGAQEAPASEEAKQTNQEKPHDGGRADAGGGDVTMAEEPAPSGGAASSGSHGPPPVREGAPSGVPQKRSSEQPEEQMTKRARESIAYIAAVEKLARNECEETAVEMTAEWPSEEQQLQLKFEEFDRFEEFEAFTPVPRGDARRRPLSMVWVIEQRSGTWKARLCARPFGRPSKLADEVCCPTPFPSTIRVLLALASVRNYAAKIFDVSRAFLHTPAREDVWVEPPPEWPNPQSMVWYMNCTLYGLQEAMADFDSYFDKVLQGKLEPDGRDKTNLKRHVADPASWSGDGVFLLKHVDDGLIVGPIELIDETLEKLKQYFKLRVTEALAMGKPEKLLGGYIESRGRLRAILQGELRGGVLESPGSEQLGGCV